jgi:hypothetical protein
MFILRKLVYGTGKSATESNQIIGDSYQTVSEYNDGWEHLRKEWEDEQIYMFVVCKSGSEVIPLYKKQVNYIMTGEGTTFEKLTFRD